MEAIFSKLRTEITFREDGIIELSSKLADVLGIENGDRITFVKDGEELYIMKDDNGALCIQTTKAGRFFRVSWVDACRKITGLKTSKYKIGEVIYKDEHKMVTIITRRNYAETN